MYKLEQTVNMFNQGCSSFQRAVEALEAKSFSDYETALLSAARDVSDSLELTLKIYLQYFPKLPREERRRLRQPNFHDLVTLMKKYAEPPLKHETGIRLYGWRDMRNQATHEGAIPSINEVRNAIDGVRQIILTYLPVEKDQLKRDSSSFTSEQRLQIHLRADTASLSTEGQDGAITALATVLKISPHLIKVYGVYAGDLVTFDLGIPIAAMQYLRNLLRANNSQLHRLKIEKIKWESEPDDFEAWTLNNGKFITARARIFVCCEPQSELDSEIARQVSQALGPQHDVFMEMAEDPPPESIKNELRLSDFFIVFLSDKSVHSEEVRLALEMAHQAAQEQGYPIILPVLLAYRQPFEPPLNTYLDSLNLSYWRSDVDTPRIIKELQGAVAGGSLPVNETLKQKLWQDYRAPSSITSSSLSQSVALESPEGTMDPTSPFYVERPGDKVVTEEIEREGVTITIKGPRQVGKSSMLMRITAAAENKGKQVALLDFQFLDKSALSDADTFYRQFCAWITDELDIEDRVAEFWKQPLGNSLRCTRYMERHLLKQLDAPLLLAMDEVDTVFDTAFRDDFFGMLRGWHNSRARPQRRIWKAFDMALVTSTEPYQFVGNLNQSPFNVGSIIELIDFFPDQVADLNRRHGTPLRPAEEQQLMALTGGHPYLVRKALYLTASRQITPPEIFVQATMDNGPFGAHLRHHLTRLQVQSELKEGFKQIIQHHTCPDETIFFRLQGAGLVRREHDTVMPRCNLYDNYFRERLSD